MGNNCCKNETSTQAETTFSKIQEDMKKKNNASAVDKPNSRSPVPNGNNLPKYAKVREKENLTIDSPILNLSKQGSMAMLQMQQSESSEKILGSPDKFENPRLYNPIQLASQQHKDLPKIGVNMQIKRKPTTHPAKLNRVHVIPPLPHKKQPSQQKIEPTPPRNTILKEELISSASSDFDEKSVKNSKCVKFSDDLALERNLTKSLSQRMKRKETGSMGDNGSLTDD